MRLPILSFVFIVLCHVSIAQTPVASSSLQSDNSCPLMEVSINSNNHSGIVEVSYCNHGNRTAIGAYVEIEITNDLLIAQSTIPILSVIDKTYTFYLGDVSHSTCAAFYIEIPNVDNKIHCTNVRIYPNDPCQEMIDRYNANHTGDNNDGNRFDEDDDRDHVIDPATATSSAELYQMVPGLPILGQGGNTSVFEDHVFLNNIPTWDSLLVVLTNSGVLPNTVTADPSGSTNPVNSVHDIATLVSAELCSGKKVGTVVLSDHLGQTTSSIAVSDRTLSGTTVSNNQASSNQEPTKTANNKYDNKEVAVRLYPNPFSTRATITIDGGSYKQTTLEIIDLAGKTIQSLQFNEEETITLYRGNLSQGVYFYRLIGDNTSVHTGKFVVR